MKTLTAYEMDAGPLGRYWEVYEHNEHMVDHVEPDEMGDYIAAAVADGYDVEINTFDSWVHLE